MKTPKLPQEHKREFWCITCAQKNPMDLLQMQEHLKSVHGLTSPLKGSRSGQFFMDLAGGYSNQYEWKLGDVRLTEVSSGPKGMRR